MPAIYIPTNSRRLIKVPALTLDEYSERLRALGLSQMQLHQLTDISRLRIRSILESDEKTAKSNGDVYRYMTLFLILLESGILYEDAFENHDIENLQEILKKAVDTKK